MILRLLLGLAFAGLVYGYARDINEQVDLTVVSACKNKIRHINSVVFNYFIF